MKHADAAGHTVLGMIGTAMTQIQDPALEAVTTVGSAAASFLIVEFLKAFISAYKARRAKKGE